MKHTSKRLQALVLVLAMCVSFLQIPSFAAETHAGTYNVGKVTIDDNGKVTITEYCDNHSKGDACNTVTGEIETKKDKNGLIEASDVFKITSGKLKTDYEVSGSVTAQNVATCKDDSIVTYTVNVGQSYTNKVTLSKATGEHKFAPVPENATYEILTNNTNKDNYLFVSTTATCNKAGEATFQKKCIECGQPIADALVTVPQSVITDGHKFITETVNGQTVKKVFEEVDEAPTCAKEGKKYQWIECTCGIKKYKDANGEFTAESKGAATKQTIERLPHPYEYTVEPTGKAYAGGQELTKYDFTVTGTCPTCKATTNATDVSVADAKLVADKTVVPEFACVPGSKTYAVTYTISAETLKAEKSKDVTVEVTVPYYLNRESIGKEHDYDTVQVPDEDSVVKATCTKDGHYNMVEVCKVCGDKRVKSVVKIPANGKHTAAAAKKENVVAATTKKGGSYDLVVRCADCGEIISSTHKTTAKIVVKASKINSVKNYKGKKAKITVKKAASVTGYQIQYGTKKNFKGAKSVKTKATTKTVSKLAKKKYYVRVRTYKVVSGKTYYSSWSGAKTVTIKK